MIILFRRRISRNFAKNNIKFRETLPIWCARYGSRFKSNRTRINETAEAKPAVSMRLQKKILCVSMELWKPYQYFHIIFVFNGVNDISEISMRLWQRIQQFQWDHWSGFCGFNGTVEADSTMSMRSQNPVWHLRSLRENAVIPFKGEQSQKQHLHTYSY
jgi:hypothetical protein